MGRRLLSGPEVVAPGAVHLPGWLDAGTQRSLARSCAGWAEQSGGFRAPSMPRGGVMSVAITCLGWHWSPYRYSRSVDDGDGRPVLPFPGWLGDLSRQAVTAASTIDDRVGGPLYGGVQAFRPDVALVNWYGPGARMGMHADRDERSPAPVVSFSFGDSCVFRFGGTAGRTRPWHDVVLESGDAFVFGGPSRLAYHGVPQVLVGTADPSIGVGEGRLNITVRESGLDDGSDAAQLSAVSGAK